MPVWVRIRLGPFLVVDFSVFVRLHVLTTLKVKCEHDGHAISIRPVDLFPEMQLLHDPVPPFDPVF
jgi:hypothetical protein